MSEETINIICLVLFCSIMLFGGFFKINDYFKSKRTPLQKFKPGTKVWFIDLSDSSPKSDHYKVKFLPIGEDLIIYKGVQYFSIKYTEYMATEKELFLKAEDVIKHLESLKSKSNE